MGTRGSLPGGKMAEV